MSPYHGDADAAEKASGRTKAKATSDGAFYTTTLAADMLAGLTMRSYEIDWTDPLAVMGLKMIDPACGNGALMLGGLRAIKRQVEATGRWTPGAVAYLMRFQAEQRIIGWDIDQGAVDEAVTAVADYCRAIPEAVATRIICLPHGPQPDGTWASGALDKLVELMTSTGVTPQVAEQLLLDLET